MTPVAERRAAAYEKLGVKPELVQTVPDITVQLRYHRQLLRDRHLPGDPYYYLRCSDTEDSHKLMSIYYALQPASVRRLLPIEAFCIAAGVSTLRILSDFINSCRKVSAQMSSLMVVAAHPRVVEKHIARALDDANADNLRYTEMLHKAVGFLPTPRGSQTTITLTQNAQANVAPAGAPSPEQTIRRLADLFNARELPSPPVTLPGLVEVDSVADNVVDADSTADDADRELDNVREE